MHRRSQQARLVRVHPALMHDVWAGIYQWFGRTYDICSDL
jgi:hypothetical protein